ncbi:isocitrate lyase/PEP mutase family protein [Brevibacterium jeotgali]|uniref:2-Methylisocitrate lyase, PEP mutase family n=1 Tax=Brevibacterium jeotgali TaxID=1262550 RepID=A0A2H1L2P3_9MICO|nr:isocitrate lyase/phosphoenolpyruvate mutase family protein [Brevibacterium jeotgali]TWC02368.1 2-methylisocitrate lyase-like PEP mutase family enzyme [Brevibacterium jeotgali]SMY11162.1 2-Methylisocitrate lyase, PEP mutase family [Brevibacterium jeotgali]
MADIKDTARTFAEAHESGDLLVLPTVWDAWSARLAESAGFPGLTIGSHPVGDALGPGDGEAMDFADYMEATRRIVASVEVPVSVDVESGYGLTPEALVEQVLDAGAVGINVEDTVRRENGRLRERAEHADYIAGAREAADAAGVDLVVNGRTDALIHGTALFEDPLAEAVARVAMLEKAGARSVYPVGLPDSDAAKAVVGAVGVPVNVTAHPVNGAKAGSLEQLRAIGVRRVSFGPLWQAALAEVSTQQLRAWKD